MRGVSEAYSLFVQVYYVKKTPPLFREAIFRLQRKDLIFKHFFAYSESQIAKAICTGYYYKMYF